MSYCGKGSRTCPRVQSIKTVSRCAREGYPTDLEKYKFVLYHVIYIYIFFFILIHIKLEMINLSFYFIIIISYLFIYYFLLLFYIRITSSKALCVLTKMQDYYTLRRLCCVCVGVGGCVCGYVRVCVCGCMWVCVWVCVWVWFFLVFRLMWNNFRLVFLSIWCVHEDGEGRGREMRA